MNQFIKYLSKKYNFNQDEEWTLFQESTPVKTQTEIFEFMLTEMCTHAEVSVNEVVGRTRKREAMYARHLLAYCLYKTGAFSLNDIGLKLGGRNHATIINSKEVVEDLLSVKDDIMYPLYLKIKHLINENNTSRGSYKL